MKDIVLFCGVFFLLSCKNNTTQNYTINESQIDLIVSTHDTTLFLFWTSWCGGSKERLKEYFVLDSFLKNNHHRNVAVITIAADDNVSDSLINEQRKNGISAYRIADAGANAFINRLQLKRFLKSNFDEKELKNIHGFFYPVPIELLVTKDFKIFEEDTSNNILKYRYAIQGVKVEVHSVK